MTTTSKIGMAVAGVAMFIALVSLLQPVHPPIPPSQHFLPPFHTSGDMVSLEPCADNQVLKSFAAVWRCEQDQTATSASTVTADCSAVTPVPHVQTVPEWDGTGWACKQVLARNYAPTPPVVLYYGYRTAVLANPDAASGYNVYLTDSQASTEGATGIRTVSFNQAAIPSGSYAAGCPSGKTCGFPIIAYPTSEGLYDTITISGGLGATYIATTGTTMIGAVEYSVMRVPRGQILSFWTGNLVRATWDP